MATNAFKNTQLVVDGTIDALHKGDPFIGLIDKQYDSKFAVSGAKVGATISIKKPARFTTSVGKVTTPQDYIEEFVNLTISTQRQGSMEFGSVEETLDLNSFKKDVADPFGLQMSNDIAEDVLGKVITSVGNTVISATTLEQIDVVQAGVKMTQGTTPTKGRCLLIDPADEGDYTVANKGLFNPSSEIAKEFTESAVGRANGFDWFRSNNLPVITMPVDVAGTVGANYVAGEETISLAGFGIGQVIQAGTVIEVVGTLAVKTESKTTLGYKYQISVRETITLDGAGAGIASIEPMFGATQNGRQNVSAIPISGAVANIIGDSGASYRQQLCFIKKAFTMGTADLVNLMTGHSARSNFDGIAGRFVQDGDAINDTNISRFDVLYGQRCLRPEYACKIWVKVV